MFKHSNQRYASRPKSMTLAVTCSLLLCALLLGLSSCSKVRKDNLILVSVEPQRAILEEIVGDKFEVVTVLTPGSNPETFEPGMQARKQMEEAAAYFTTGHLPFEKKLRDAINDDEMRFVDTSKDIKLVYGTHDHSHGDHSHESGEADPHVWTSVRNARIMAKNMLNEVIKMDPDNKDYYTERWGRLDTRLDSLDRAFAAQLEAEGTAKAFVIWHPSLSYIERDYGVEQIPVGFENKEMPAKQLQHVIEKAKELGAKVFFFQKEYDSRQAETLNKELGTRLVTINPLAYDWEGELRNIVSQLCQ